MPKCTSSNLERVARVKDATRVYAGYIHDLVWMVDFVEAERKRYGREEHDHGNINLFRLKQLLHCAAITLHRDLGMSGDGRASYVSRTGFCTSRCSSSSMSGE